jgi:NADH-quinone oxidoreductase subunit C
MVTRDKDDDTPKPPDEDSSPGSNVLPFPSGKSETSDPPPVHRRVPGSAPPREAPPAPAPLDNELTRRFRDRFGTAIVDTTIDRGQAILLIDPHAVLDVAKHCRGSESFEMLVDLTAVDWPGREKRFDVIWNLYSFTKNERLRLKAHLGAGEHVASVTGVWAAVNWLERECFDLFGIAFDGHPNLRRILLPDEWRGHPLRKDYDILTQDTDWVRENLGIESGQ